MTETTRDTLLRMIRDHSGTWGWYQIDRALGFEGISGVNVPQAMLELIEQGLVEGTGVVQLATTTYALTNKGQAAVALPSVPT